MNFNKKDIFNFVENLTDVFPGNESESCINFKNRDYKILARRIGKTAEVSIFDDKNEKSELIILNFDYNQDNQINLNSYKEFRKLGNTQKIINFQIDKKEGHISVKTLNPSISFNHTNSIESQIANCGQLDLSRLIEDEETNNLYMTPFRDFELTSNAQTDEEKFGELIDDFTHETEAFPLEIISNNNNGLEAE